MRIQFFILVILALLVSALPASAQTVATRTTLSGAITATATTITLASGTGFTAGNFVYVDNEVMRIVSVSGANITVQRGQLGTVARAHANAEPVITGAAGHFQTTDPDYGATCTRGSGQAVFLPRINVLNGLVWQCGGEAENGRSGLAWTATTTSPVTYNSIPGAF